MAAADTSLLAALEDVVQHGSSSRRAEMMQQITGLFVKGAGSFNDEHVRFFDGIFNRLMAEIEDKALAELATQLADVHNAPPKVVRRLAHNDDIAVAGPVLQRSGRIEEADLVEVARSKSQAHLLAIAGRKEIGHAVIEIVIRRGDRDVVRNVVANPGARLSQASFLVLVKKAEADGILAERVGQRPDVPTVVFRALLARATEVVQKRMLASARPEIREEIARALAAASAEMANGATQRDYTAAVKAVAELQRAAKLHESALAGFAEQGRFEETVASLAVLCKVPLEIVDRLMHEDRPDPVLIACKAAGFGWPTVRAILMTRAQSNGVPSQSLDAASRNFERLSAATAERVVRFWHAHRAIGGNA